MTKNSPATLCAHGAFSIEQSGTIVTFSTQKTEENSVWGQFSIGIEDFDTDDNIHIKLQHEQIAWLAKWLNSLLLDSPPPPNPNHPNSLPIEPTDGPPHEEP